MNQIPNIEETNTREFDWRTKLSIERNEPGFNIEDFIHQQLQKARQDWLREEIEWLKMHRNIEYTSAFQTIIDRYHSELDQDKT